MCSPKDIQKMKMLIAALFLAAKDENSMSTNCTMNKLQYTPYNVVLYSNKNEQTIATSNNMDETNIE